MQNKAAIVVLDGWGLGKRDKSDAVWTARTPITDKLSEDYAFTTLRTDGENVGLPAGQMGNSEVGHMNIGAGRIVWQMLVKIDKAFKTGEFENNVVWNKIVSDVHESNALHFIGLVSDGGVHSHMNHLVEMCKSASNRGIKRIFIHAFLDGRDTDPNSGLGFLQELNENVAGTGAVLTSIIGRYYAMDRDKRWERVKKCWDLLVKGKGLVCSDFTTAVEDQYKAGITDEFLEPVKLGNSQNGLIKEGDVVVCFNFRTDRGRQITEALTQKNFPEFDMQTLNLKYYTMTAYDVRFNIEGVLFETDNLNKTLGEVLSENNKTQLRAAETEKYPHVSFFFSGGREELFKGENRLLVNSPKVATYDLKPAMSAPELTEKAIGILKKDSPDFMILNYANPDMVGHTGVFTAIVSAVETVDACLGKLMPVLLENNYHSLIIADHGNADYAVNEDGTANTAHSLNPVPCWLVSKEISPKLNAGILADVAPTILKMMNIVKPDEMSGVSLY